MSNRVRTHIPQRTCSACGRKGPKENLVRIALFYDEKKIEVDRVHALGGRGVYLCREHECVQEFIKRAKKGKMKRIATFPRNRIEDLSRGITDHISKVNTMKGVF